MTTTVRVLSILWWTAVIVSPCAIYWVFIRPKIKWSDVGAELGLWSRIKARVSAFRTVIVGQLGVLVMALPDLLQLLGTVDFSVLPQPWAAFAGPAVSGALILVRAFSAAPHGVKPDGAA